MPQGMKKGVAFYLTGQIISGIFLLVFNISAARILGPEKYGILSVFYALLLTVSTLMSGGMHDGMVKYISSYEAEKKGIGNILKGGFLFFLAIYIIVFFVIFIGKRYFAVKFFNGNMVITYIFIVGIFLLPIWTYGFSVLEGLREFSCVAITNSTVYVLMSGIFIAFVYLSGTKGVFAGIYAITFSLLAGAILSGIFILNKGKIHLSPLDKGVFYKFLTTATILNFLDVFILRSPPIFIKIFGGTMGDKLAGMFSSTFSLVSSGRSLLLAVFSVLMPHIALAEGEKNPALARQYIKKGSLYVFPLVGGIILIFVIWGPEIIRLIYGNKFIISRIDVILITLIMSFYLTAKLANRIFVGKGIVRENLYYLFIVNAFLIILLFFIKVSPLLRVEIAFNIALFSYNVILWKKVRDYYFRQK